MGAKELLKNQNLLTWYAIISVYLRNCTRAEATAIPFPQIDCGIATDMFRIYPLLSCIPAWISRFEDHNFSDDEIKSVFGVLYQSLNLSKISMGKYCFTQIYYNWTLLYTWCEIFDCGSFNFQFIKMKSPIILLRNRESGKHTIMMTDGEFHRSGRILGSAGFEDTEGSFAAEFTETDEAYVGHTACDSLVSKEIIVLKKSEWECVAKAGDDMLSIHIPKNADLSKEAILTSFENGMKIAKERFPERNPKFIFCSSWIIDAQLEDFLSDKSRIIGLAKSFLRFPIKSKTGRDGFSFIFSGYNGPESELPEDTSLRKKIKSLYLNGGYTYSSSGFYVEY